MSQCTLGAWIRGRVLTVLQSLVLGRRVLVCWEFAVAASIGVLRCNRADSVLWVLRNDRDGEAFTAADWTGVARILRRASRRGDDTRCMDCSDPRGHHVVHLGR